MQNHSVSSMRRFCKAWYIVNAFALVLYCIPRLWFADLAALSPYAQVKDKATFFAMERGMIGVTCLFAGFKALRRETYDGFFQDFFIYGKVMVLYLLFLMDARICGIFAYAYLVQYALLSQPLYDGPRSYGVPLNPQTLHDDVLADKASGRRHLVLFGAAWSADCVAFAPLFAALSLQYARDDLGFGEVDVAAWPALAKQFKISLNVWSGQLPTLIMFEKGSVALQVPPPARASQVKKKGEGFRRKAVVKFFDLDRRPKEAQKGSDGKAKGKSC